STLKGVTGQIRPDSNGNGSMLFKKEASADLILHEEAHRVSGHPQQYYNFNITPSISSQFLLKLLCGEGSDPKLSSALIYDSACIESLPSPEAGHKVQFTGQRNKLSMEFPNLELYQFQRWFDPNNKETYRKKLHEDLLGGVMTLYREFVSREDQSIDDQL